VRAKSASALSGRRNLDLRELRGFEEIEKSSRNFSLDHKSRLDLRLVYVLTVRDYARA